MRQRAPGVNLRTCNALHYGVRPADVSFGGDGDNRFLHGVKDCGEFLSSALKLRKILPSRSAVLVECSFHGRELIVAAFCNAGFQIALSNAAYKCHYDLKPLPRCGPLPTQRQESLRPTR